MKELKELQSNGMSDQYYKSLLSALKKLGYSTQDLDYDEISDVAQKAKRIMSVSIASFTGFIP